MRPYRPLITPHNQPATCQCICRPLFFCALSFFPLKQCRTTWGKAEFLPPPAPRNLYCPTTAPQSRRPRCSTSIQGAMPTNPGVSLSLGPLSFFEAASIYRSIAHFWTYSRLRIQISYITTPSISSCNCYHRGREPSPNGTRRISQTLTPSGSASHCLSSSIHTATQPSTSIITGIDTDHRPMPSRLYRHTQVTFLLPSRLSAHRSQQHTTSYQLWHCSVALASCLNGVPGKKLSRFGHLY